jgi:Pyruvate/2-oxoacid:ferredoxin oxidoreductase gamma subunit
MENMALLGATAATGSLGIDLEVFRAQIRATVPTGTGEANVRAFDLGADSILATAGRA